MKTVLSYLLTIAILIAIMCSPSDEQAENYKELTLLFWGGIFTAALVVTCLNTSRKEEEKFLDNQQK